MLPVAPRAAVVVTLRVEGWPCVRAHCSIRETDSGHHPSLMLAAPSERSYLWSTLRRHAGATMYQGAMAARDRFLPWVAVSLCPMGMAQRSNLQEAAELNRW
nr:unnamed protein product [Digitaria exilis]